MNYRGLFSSKETPSTATNLQRDSYDYGYGGGRPDLPAVGYNPVYPSQQTSSNNTSTYRQSLDSNPYASQQYGYQASSAGTTYASPYSEYNPDYPSYGHRHQQDQGQTSIIRVDRSRYSVKNTLYKNFVAPRNLTIVQEAAAPSTNMPAASQRQETQKRKVTEAPPSEIITVEDLGDSIIPAQQNKIVALQNEKTRAPSRRPPSNNNSQPQRGWMNQDFGAAPWHSCGPMQQQQQLGGTPWHHQPQPMYGGGLPMGSWHGMPIVGGRGGRGGGRATTSRIPYNNKNDLPFQRCEDGTLTLQLKIEPDNIHCFNGPGHIFTTQHVSPVMIENAIYESIDHFYQYRKLIDLCGSASEKIGGSIRDRRGVRQDKKKSFGEKQGQSFGQIAREQLKLNGVSRQKQEEWRRGKGLQAIQDGLMAKMSQSLELRTALAKTEEKILAHTYEGDTIYATGSTPPQVKKWAANMKKSGNATLTIPATFPLTEETVKNCPTFSHGRNVLGVILMQLRDMLAHSSINIVDMTALLEAIKNGKDPEEAFLMDTAN